MPIDGSSKTSDIAPSNRIPLPPEIFKGRENVVNEIAEHLASGHRSRTRVCILAPGGMGKTSTSLAVMQHPSIAVAFPSHRQLWIPCIGLSSPSAFLTRLANALQVKPEEGDPLPMIKSVLETNGPYIILIDNFETTWHPSEGTQMDMANLLQELDCIPNLAILLSMRSEYPPMNHWTSIKLQPLDINSSLDVWTAIHPVSRGDPSLPELLDAIGCLPYAIVLMATQALRSRILPNNLLAEWRKGGISGMPAVSDKMDHSIRLSLNAILHNREALELLQILSMLPAGVLCSYITTWTGSRSLLPLSILCERALLVVREVETSHGTQEQYYVLPVLQSYMHQNGQISPDICQDVFEACLQLITGFQSGFDESRPTYGHDMALMAVHESNVRVLVSKKLHELERGEQTTAAQRWTDALDVFIGYLYWGISQPILVKQVANHISRVKPGSWDEAEAHYNLAYQYHKASLHESAIEHWERAKTVYQQLGGVKRAFDCEMLIIGGRSWIGTNADDGGMALLSLFDDIQSRYEHQDADSEIIAEILFRRANLGFSRNILPTNEVRQLSYKALQLFPAVYYPLRVYDCLAVIACSYLKDQLSNDAIKVIYNMEQLANEARIPSLYRHYLYHTRYLKGIGQWNDSMVSQIRQFIRKARTVGSHHNLIAGLEEIGEIYIHNKEWTSAQSVYREILELCNNGSAYTFEGTSERYSNNLGYAQSMMEGQTQGSPDFLPPSRY
jgi:tetratricopeptide (TPR) repeat protein